MKADWDDAPDHLRRKSPDFNPIVFTSIGAVVTAVALFIGSTYWSPKTPIHAPAEPEAYEPKYEFNEAPKASGPSPEEQFWRDQEKRQQQPKQTVFNDNNYIPIGADNVVSTEGLRQSLAYQNSSGPERATRQRSVETVHRTISSWDKHTIYHRASWTFVDDRIDGRSVCSYYKRGSIDYRDCRKGAKQHFHEECRKWRAIKNESNSDQSVRMMDRYCTAASSFSPMG